MIDYTKFPIERATEDDYDEIVDESNYIFTVETDENGNETYDRRYFQNFVTKLYRDKTCSMPAHYFIRDAESGKIVSIAGAFENTMQVGDTTLVSRGIGTVGVDPHHRSKGYMKAIMFNMMADCKRDGIDFSYLGGLRQRYEHFGFSTSGVSAAFQISGGNMDYLFGRNAAFGYTFRVLTDENDAALDDIASLHATLPVRVKRERARLFDILGTWSRQGVVIERDGAFFGWLINDKNQDHIFELVLTDESKIGEVLCDYIRQTQVESVCISEVGLYETQKIRFLSRSAETMQLMPHEQYRIYRFAHMIDAYLTLKAKTVPLCDGTLTVCVTHIDDETPECFSVTVKNQTVTIAPFSGNADLNMNEILATEFFFGTERLMSDLGFALPAGIAAWFPLPLCYRDADGV